MSSADGDRVAEFPSPPIREGRQLVPGLRAGAVAHALAEPHRDPALAVFELPVLSTQKACVALLHQHSILGRRADPLGPNGFLPLADRHERSRDAQTAAARLALGGRLGHHIGHRPEGRRQAGQPKVYSRPGRIGRARKRYWWLGIILVLWLTAVSAGAEARAPVASHPVASLLPPSSSPICLG